MSEDKLNHYEETEDPAIVVVDANTFEVVTDIRIFVDQGNGFVGFEVTTEHSTDPITFPSHEALAKVVKAIDGVPSELRTMELSLNSVTRYMELNYLRLKAIQYQEKELQQLILMYKEELDKDAEYMRTHYDAEHRKTVDDTLLRLFGI